MTDHENFPLNAYVRLFCCTIHMVSNKSKEQKPVSADAIYQIVGTKEHNLVLALVQDPEFKLTASRAHARIVSLLEVISNV